MNNYTPSELIVMIPNCPFTREEIGFLLRMKLVKGWHKSKSTEIDLESFKKVLEWRNSIIDSHKIIF